MYMIYGEPSSPLMMGNPYPGEPGPSPHGATSTNLYYNVILDLGIEGSEHFGPTDLTR
jgi:hypothetical protein